MDCRGRKVLIARNAEIDEVNERRARLEGTPRFAPRFIEITYRALGEKKSGQELALNLLRARYIELRAHPISFVTI